MSDLKDWPDDFDWEALTQRIKEVLEKHGTKVFEEIYQQDRSVSGEIDWKLQKELNKVEKL
jgi:hypothetical protein